jgi:hypothetical protein
MRRIVVVMLIVLLSCAGCGLFNGGNGGDAPVLDIEELLPLIFMAVDQPVTDEMGSFTSPTCPHGFGSSMDDEGAEYPPGEAPVMTGAHQAAKVATWGLLNSGIFFTPAQQEVIRAWAASDAGAVICANIAQSACCPVYKTILVFGGWVEHEYDHPDDAPGDRHHPLYYWTRANPEEDPRVIGNPPAEGDGG